MDALRNLSPPTTWAAACGLTVVGAYLIYLYLLPKPIPGIPYHKPSAKRLLGDVPDALQYYAKHRQTMMFLQQRCEELNSPIVQVFMRPFGRPLVAISDAQESVDILARRSREFDRSDFFGDLFRGTIPHNQVLMKTNPEWRAHRRLMADTMSPHFLHTVVAPQLHRAMSDLIAFWREEMRLVKGRPIDAAEDVHKFALDAIWAATFGSSLDVIETQRQHLLGIKEIALPGSMDEAPKIPHVAPPAAFESIITLMSSTEIPMNSPIPGLHHWLALKLLPKYRAAVKAKNDMITARLDDAWKKFSNPSSEGEGTKCASELVVQQEVKMAQKEGRKPDYKSASIQDELIGYLFAGHETTATSLNWGLKLLTKHVDVQEKLRKALQEAFPNAGSDGPQPEEIAKAHVPYLDAFIEEALRFGATAVANSRVATTDTMLLGHVIPKGTDVFMLNVGGGYLKPAFPIDNSIRSKTSNQSEDKLGVWNANDISEFKPERWLVQNSHGETEFNPRSGPENVFGGGLRGCFGKKLAYVEMRMFYTLVLLSYRLLPTPEALSSWAAFDSVTHNPQQTYVRLETVA